MQSDLSAKRSEFETILRRCPSGTLEALLAYLETQDLQALNTFLVGCIHRHVEDEYEPLLQQSNIESLSFIDDLGIDSMTMMEIVMMVESCLDIEIDNQDLMQLATFGDLRRFLADFKPA